MVNQFARLEERYHSNYATGHVDYDYWTVRVKLMQVQLDNDVTLDGDAREECQNIIDALKMNIKADRVK